MTDSATSGHGMVYGYADHDRSTLDVVDEQTWTEAERYAIEKSLDYSARVACPESVYGAEHWTAKSFVDHFIGMLDNLLHTPLHNCTTSDTDKERDTKQTKIVPDGGARPEHEVTQCD